MDSQLLYQQDVSTLEFEARVVERIDLPGGRTGVVLDRTYFYPTGGGQEHDTGVVGSASVVDVYKDEDNQRLVHVVEGPLEPGPVIARIDAERRLRHMQHHTAQHLLTQCILRLTGYETVSANINGDSPSTLDLVTTHIRKGDLDAAEKLANQVIYEDKPVKTYFVTPQELQSIPLRRPPKVSENIRIVEIDSFDYSPCGGTHVLRTGSIGLLKVLKAERMNDKTRIHFIAGWQALDVFRQMYDALADLANRMSTSWQEIPALFSRQAEQHEQLKKDLQALRQVSVKYEAIQLIEAAHEQAGTKLVRAHFANRPLPELRMLAEELKAAPATVAVLSSYDGKKLSLIVTCSEGTGKEAPRLLNQLLASIGGRGGGDARLAQGGGAATEEQAAALQQASVLGG